MCRGCVRSVVRLCSCGEIVLRATNRMSLLRKLLSVNDLRIAEGASPKPLTINGLVVLAIKPHAEGDNPKGTNHKR